MFYDGKSVFSIFPQGKCCFSLEILIILFYEYKK